MNLIIDVKSINPYNDGILRKIIFLQYLPTFIGLVDQMGTRFDRLRYAPKGARQQRRKATMRSTHHKYLSEAKVKQRRYATVPTACGIETLTCSVLSHLVVYRCNNTYRLRYAPKGARQQRSKATMRSTHLKYLNEEKVKQR